jgi:hypothetical protein
MESRGADKILQDFDLKRKKHRQFTTINNNNNCIQKSVRITCSASCVVFEVSFSFWSRSFCLGHPRMQGLQLIGKKIDEKSFDGINKFDLEMRKRGRGDCEKEKN